MTSETETVPAPSAPIVAVRPTPLWWGALMGVLAAAAGLAAAELVAGFSRRLTSPVVSIGDRVVDHVPPGVKRLAIDWFATNDKRALVIGILTVLGICAALVGIATARGRRDVAIGGSVVLGAIGIWASATGRNTSMVGVIPSIVAALVACAVLLVVHRIVTVSTPAPPADAASTSKPAAISSIGRPSRRTLLVTAGGVAAGTALTGSIGRMLHQRLSNAAERASITLPSVNKKLPAAPADPAVGLPGLSPLFTPNASFYRIDTAIVVPSVSLGSWKLKVTGMVDKELELTFDDLLALPQIEADITISCVSNEVGGDLVGNARWQGVRLDDLLAKAGISAQADQIVGRSVDGFTAGFPTTTLDGRTALVALAMNGEPLPAEHGFPARLIVPGLYGYVSATKWLSSIELTRFDQVQGYWIPRGWSALGPIKTESRIDRPGGRIVKGTVAIAGVAWAPHRGVSTVEVRVDDGPWRPATLGPSVGDDSWRQWWIDWDATPGTHKVSCRATDGTGAVQTEDEAPVAPDGATGWHTIGVEVSAS